MSEQLMLKLSVEKKRSYKQPRVSLTQKKIRLLIHPDTDKYHFAVCRTLALNAYVEVGKKGWPGILWGSFELGAGENDSKVWTLRLTLKGTFFMTVYPPKKAGEDPQLVQPATLDEIKQLTAPDAFQAELGSR